MANQLDLLLDHEPCINHWAILMADEDVARGYHTNWDAAYESAWNEIELNVYCGFNVYDIRYKMGE